MAPANLPRLAEISIDPLVLTFTLAVSLLSGLLFGLIPVLKYGRPLFKTFRDVLHGGSRTIGRGQHRSQNALVVAQVGLDPKSTPGPYIIGQAPAITLMSC